MTQTWIEPGWYADPAQPGAWRWWDGSGWTEHVSPPPAAQQPAFAAPDPRTAAAQQYAAQDGAASPQTVDHDEPPGRRRLSYGRPRVT